MLQEHPAIRELRDNLTASKMEARNIIDNIKDGNVTMSEVAANYDSLIEEIDRTEADLIYELRSRR